MSTNLDSGTYLRLPLLLSFLQFLSFPFSVNIFKREKSTISDFMLGTLINRSTSRCHDSNYLPRLSLLSRISLYACSQFDCRALRNYGASTALQSLSLSLLR